MKEIRSTPKKKKYDKRSKNWATALRYIKEVANIVLNINRKLAYNPSEIANSFNGFLTGVASALVSKLSCTCSHIYATKSAKMSDFYHAKNKDSN